MSDLAPLTALEPDAKNTNRHTERGRQMTRKSVDKFGPRKPMELDRNGVVLDGNDRLSIYEGEGVENVKIIKHKPGEVIAVQYDDFDLNDPGNPAREYQIAQGRSAAVSFEIDPAGLEFAIEGGIELGDWFDPGELELFGVDGGGVGDSQDAPAQVDRAGELREAWQTELGQLWKLPSRTAGQAHYMMGGDCTDAAVVERVTGGGMPVLMVTDPPYGIEHKNDVIPTDSHKEHEGIANDSRDADEFVKKFIQSLSWFDKGSFYIFGAYVQFPTWYTRLTEWRKVNQVLAWVKDNAVLSRLHFNLKFELIYHGYTSADVWNGDDTQDDVLQYRNVNSFGYIKDGGEKNLKNDAQTHPHQKPLDLITDLVKLSSNPGSLVYEPFAGSGTTVLACENTGRQCRAIEISPAYCAVALDRYEKAFGLRGELVE